MHGATFCVMRMMDPCNGLEHYPSLLPPSHTHTGCIQSPGSDRAVPRPHALLTPSREDGGGGGERQPRCLPTQ